MSLETEGSSGSRRVVTSRQRESILAIVDRCLRKRFPDDFHKRCAYGALGVHTLLRDAGVPSRLVGGDFIAFIVARDNRRAGLAGFGFAEEGCAHFWVESDTAILDLGLSYLPNEASYPVARMPAAAWGPIDRLPAYLRYRPTQQFPEDVGFSPDPVIRDRANAFVAECRARWATQKGHLPHPTWIMTDEVAVAAAARRKDPWALGALRFASMTDLADLPF